jgi:orotidine-5'-phosphate decarboxylase
MNSPLIIALDVESADQARRLVRQLGDAGSFYKVGLELYAAAGMEMVRELTGEGKQVFLDLKLYDISETVKRAVARIASSGARFLTIHASNPVMRAAVEGAAGSNLELLAVTVLTNYDEQDLRDDGINWSVSELVAHRVRNAVKAGAHGIVCSALEVRTVRTLAGPDKILVTPGVRSAGADAGDQKRIATPAEALHNGSNYLVIGRQVTRATNPLEALLAIQEETRNLFETRAC